MTEWRKRIEGKMKKRKRKKRRTKKKGRNQKKREKREVKAIKGRHVGEVFMRILDNITICIHGGCKLSTTKKL
jgi:hypothetical protein